MTSNKYEVVWTNVAQRDLNRIIDYIAVDSIANAKSILKKIKNKANELYSFPSKGRVLPELKLYNINNYREIIINPWRIIYSIEENYVYINSVIDGRRNAEDILLDRFMEN